MNRIHARSASNEEKRQSGGSTLPKKETTDSDVADSDQAQEGRRIFFNIPLPADMKDEQGHITASYPRNKVRTAKYTALTFIPLDLWLQFHNVANIYFLFIIILSVSPLTAMVSCSIIDDV